MTIFINPGSGPVADATEEQAVANLRAFIDDLRNADGSWWGDMDKQASFPAQEVTIREQPPIEDEGRWTFFLLVDGAEREIDMPGLPLERVRYIRTEDQNIWDYPRLYVDGSSWVWYYALRTAVHFLDEEV